MIVRLREDKMGFSLVELIIVIAIVAILSGGVALGLGLTRSPHSLSLANALNTSFADLRSENQAKAGRTYMNLYRLSDGYYVQFTEKDPLTSVPATGEDGKKIGNKDCVIRLSGGTFDSTYVYSFTMEKKDGSFGSSYKKSKGGTSSNVSYHSSGATEISVMLENGNSPHKVILVTTTGRHYTE